MRIFISAIIAISFCAVPLIASAQGVISKNYSCEEMKSLVADSGSLLVSKKPNKPDVFELVFSSDNIVACNSNATSGKCRRFRVPTTDRAFCRIGYVETHFARDDEKRETPAPVVVPTPEPEPDPEPDNGDYYGDVELE